MDMTIIATITTKTPAKTALWFQTILAVDRGWSSTIEVDGAARIVVAEDGKAVRFERP